MQDLKDEQRRKERLQREKRLKSLQNLKSDAEKRGQQYEQKVQFICLVFCTPLGAVYIHLCTYLLSTYVTVCDFIV